jgi:peptidoglycan/LPS O-acetylase OafA/YrhL
MQESRNTALDGIRGVAILSVVLFHATMGLGYNWWPIKSLLKITQAGWLGVDVFFALSGFLITGILWKSKNEKASLRYYLSRFYFRRVLRIFPLYFGVLIILLLIPILIPVLRDADYERFVQMQPWFWLHAANIAREFYGVTNPVLEFGRFELTHFWSLSVEEHFYLFWPLLLYFLGRRSILLVTLILVVISTVLKLGLVEISPVLAATPKYLAGLAIGSAAAIYPLLFGRRFLWLCILVLFMMVIWLGVTSEYSYIFSPLISAICACFCVDVTSKKSIYNRPLSNPLLIMFGKYSYGMSAKPNALSFDWATLRL